MENVCLPVTERNLPTAPRRKRKYAARPKIGGGGGGDEQVLAGEWERICLQPQDEKTVFICSHNQNIHTLCTWFQRKSIVSPQNDEPVSKLESHPKPLMPIRNLVSVILCGNTAETPDKIKFAIWKLRPLKESFVRFNIDTNGALRKCSEAQMLRDHVKNKYYIYEEATAIWSCHCSDYVVHYILGRHDMQSGRNLPKFRNYRLHQLLPKMDGYSRARTATWCRFECQGFAHVHLLRQRRQAQAS
jgi:hypothetical protein